MLLKISWRICIELWQITSRSWKSRSYTFTRMQLDFYLPQHYSQHTNSLTILVTQPSQQLQSCPCDYLCALTKTLTGCSNASKFWETKKCRKALITMICCSREPLLFHIFDLLSVLSTLGIPLLKTPINWIMQSRLYMTSCWRWQECLHWESGNSHSDKATRLQGRTQESWFPPLYSTH